MLSLPAPDAPKSTQSKSKTFSKRFLVIGQMEKGDYFGVGEDLRSTYIMTSTKVDCLIVPRHTVVALERSSTLTGASDIRKVVTVREMLHHAESRFLSEENAFERWISNLRWKNYKRKMLNDILSRKPPTFSRRSPRGSKTSHPQFPLAKKSSTLGYPLADSNQRSSTPIYRKAGYQKNRTCSFAAN
uniref:Cyclic nucleotide-binding domain-containing protein n=1 Tax=Ciona savignyi TaxID=51511 RepID=H2ZIA1_CIOSA